MPENFLSLREGQKRERNESKQARKEKNEKGQERKGRSQ